MCSPLSRTLAPHLKVDDELVVTHISETKQFRVEVPRRDPVMCREIKHPISGDVWWYFDIVTKEIELLLRQRSVSDEFRVDMIECYDEDAAILPLLTRFCQDGTRPDDGDLLTAEYARLNSKRFRCVSLGLEKDKDKQIEQTTPTAIAS